MEFEIELTKSNRLMIARAFSSCKRVDYSIDCAVEGTMGRVYGDDPASPTAFCIRTGPFAYFAGEPGSPGGLRLMQSLPAYTLMMPSTYGWLELAQEIFGEDLQSFPRYSFSAEALSAEHLADLLAKSPVRERVVPIDLETARQAAGKPGGFFDISEFKSAEDFIERGLGYAFREGGSLLGAAYSSLVCSRGIEVSVYVVEEFRRQGFAAALCCRLLLDCLAKGLRPNWDAANPESVRLARKLGFRFEGYYEAYYHSRGESSEARWG